MVADVKLGKIISRCKGNIRSVETADLDLCGPVFNPHCLFGLLELVVVWRWLSFPAVRCLDYCNLVECYLYSILSFL